jgi:RNA polymerase sigma-70 factor, ECF subfamily
MEALVLQQWSVARESIDLPDEATLIRQAATDPEAFSILFRQHHGHIARYIHRRTGHRAVTEDLTSEVFLTMVRYLPRYRQQGTPLRAWLYRLATNQVNRWARQRTRQQHQLLSDVAEKDQTEQQQEAAHLRHVLLQVPVHFQNALALHYLEELSVESIASILSCAVGTVKSRLARGRDLLRQLLTEQEGDS